MDVEYMLTADGELYHWGIKGMKWGQRRYQNKDGSLTPAGKKRYADELAKVEAETKKLKAEQRNKARTAAKMSKLDEAKKELAALKSKAKSKKGSEPEAEPETDAQKRERILKAPTAKDVVANSHLFSDKEIQSLQLRLDNQNKIRKLISEEEVDVGKEKMDKIMSKVADATDYAVTAAKAWNMTANVLNAFGIAPDGVSLPKIDTKIDAGNKVQRAKEKENLEKAEAAKAEKQKADAEKAKAEKAAEKAAKKEEQATKKAEKTAKKEAKAAEKAEKKRQEEMKKYEEYQENYKKSIDIDTPSTSYSSKGGDRDYVNPSESRGLSVYNSPVTSVSTSTVSRGRDNVNTSGSSSSSSSNSLMVRNPSISNVPSTVVNRGQSQVEKYMTYDEDGNFAGYWSAIKDDD